jgi:hypothetical protein
MTSFITGGESPPQSFGVQVKVTLGRNQLQRQVGNYSALYFADGLNMQDSTFELDPLKIWSSNPQETFQRLVIACSGILQFDGVRPDNSTVRLQINRLLVLDTEFRTFTLTNVGESKVRGSLNFVSTRL